MSGVVSVTDVYRPGELAALVRSVAARLPEEVRRGGGPPTRYVVCIALRVEGWPDVRMGDVVHRRHPAVAARPDAFEATAIDDGRDWGDDARTIPPAPQPRRAITPAKPTATTIVDGGRTIDYKPNARTDYEVRLSWGAYERIRQEVNHASGYAVESGGHLFAFAEPRVLVGRRSRDRPWRGIAAFARFAAAVLGRVPRPSSARRFCRGGELS